MSVLGSRAHEALVAVLIIARDSTGMTQREAVERLPEWLGFSQTTLAKIEKRRRIVAFVEAQALAEIYGTDLETIEAQQKAYLAAMAHPVTAKPSRVGKPRRKR